MTPDRLLPADEFFNEFKEIRNTSEKAGEPASALRIETANLQVRESSPWFHTAAQAGDYVTCAVSDTGVGMDEETKDRIFEPFFSRKTGRTGTGNGLGLATCYRIVKQNRGYIRVRSEPGNGATFQVFLSRSDGSKQTVREVPGTPARLSGAETILLVEDDEGVRRYTAEVLRGGGYNVMEAVDGMEEFRLVKRQPAIDLLLTDVAMPHVGGRELRELLQDYYPGIRTLFISGYADKSFADKDDLRLDAGYLQKPFTANGLLGKIGEVLDER